ncbi:Protein phosphatase 2 (Formerly 2A) regulatory subunit B [Fasciola hepatica]|uniref:Protein phosphatase 2 (Formerly 2A) regulatory subunit B n=1 Tax=Fasciola hepatica TaxID=6192 RepID=A0A4E0QX10_FASHE|nr:Protein phosphatase 2 (Formerly 2A) regulatory subunit B [Fasciola hepatica]
MSDVNLGRQEQPVSGTRFPASVPEFVHKQKASKLTPMNAKLAITDDALKDLGYQCCVAFDLENKQVKLAAVLELTNYLVHDPNTVTDAMLLQAMRMVEAELFRTLDPPSNPSGAEFGPEEI